MKIKTIFPLAAIISALTLILPSATKEEGMFPLSYLNEETLKSAGLNLSLKDIYNPGNTALTNALVKVGGCTGSFISDQGLIITNHHCVYGDVANLSNSDHNYLENGFVASTKEMELPVNMPVRITQSYEDVSARVLRGVDDKTEPSRRADTIAANIKRIIEEEKSKTPDLSCEISEMFVGKSYTLFRYLLITDVRLVFAPPVTIGQFGGDSDNWEWPRHNGDFSMVRAYVGKNGKPAPYSKDNVPYTPAKHLKINAKGTKENDFVFIMGYPGRTFRHESAGYMEYQQKIQLPQIQKWYKWNIDEMHNRSKGNENKFLAFAGDIQSLSNVEKNYRGKMQGLMRTGLVQKKFNDEDAMQEQILNSGDKDNANVVPRIREIWKRKTELSAKQLPYNFLNSQSTLFSTAYILEQADEAIEATKNAKEKSTVIQKVKTVLGKNYFIVDKGYEIAVVEELMLQLQKSGVNFNKLTGKLSIKNWIQTKMSKDILLDTAKTGKLLRTKPQSLIDSDGPIGKLVEFLMDDMKTVDKEWRNLDTELKSLMPRYLTLREKFKASQFIPDANSTLRLTYGYIRRYSPNDAEIHTPYTTMRGIFEKANTSTDYRLPAAIADNLQIKDIPAFFKDPETGEVIVCFLYNMDTTGGNSGSPVLDANGDLIGVNFDRSFTATINDYAWNERYSRSIGCDIRYILFVMKYVGKADHLFKEMQLDI